MPSCRLLFIEFSCSPRYHIGFCLSLILPEVWWISARIFPACLKDGAGRQSAHPRKNGIGAGSVASPCFLRSLMPNSGPLEHFQLTRMGHLFYVLLKETKKKKKKKKKKGLTNS